jgi:outer membrane protein OmpA-like peptidoglycan-associated protein
LLRDGWTWSRSRGGSFLARALLLAVALQTSGAILPAAAQSRETLIGTFTTRPLAHGDASRIGAAMLADALGALDRGDVMLGMRHLEALVERYPDTLAATSARAELERLYDEQRPAAWRVRGPASGSHQDREAVETRRAPTGPAVSPALPAPDDARRTSLARDFQLAAGDRVFFGESSADLGARARTVLAGQARWLARHRDERVVIEAHADDHGSQEANLELSERRAAAVRERLLDEGVDASRIEVRAFGKDRPLATCRAPECAAQNRRVVTSIGQPLGYGEHDQLSSSPNYATGPTIRRRGGRLD